MRRKLVGEIKVKIAAILPYFVVNSRELPKKHFTRMAIAVQGTALLGLISAYFYPITRNTHQEIISQL